MSVGLTTNMRVVRIFHMHRICTRAHAQTGYTKRSHTQPVRPDLREIT